MTRNHLAVAGTVLVLLTFFVLGATLAAFGEPRSVWLMRLLGVVQ